MNTVVRDRVYGQGKYHLPTDSTLTETLCGTRPSCPARFPVSGDRSDFERLCPRRICKRCRNKEASSSTHKAKKGEQE